MPVPHPTLTPEEQIVESLNRLYRVRLSVSQVEFGIPVLLPSPVETIADPQVRNSTVQISSALGESYEFTSTVHFNRLSITSLFENRNHVFPGAVTHTHDLLPALSSLFGFPVTANDIVGHTIDVPAGYPLNVLLRAAPRSLLLYGQFEITLSGP